MSDIASLGIEIDTSQLRQAADALDNFQKRSGDAEKKVDNLSKATDVLSSIVKKAAVAYAGFKVADHIKEMTLLNARYETLGISLTVVGRNSGYLQDQLNATTKALQSQGISMIESSQQTARLIQAHIDLSNASKLARIAQDAAVIANINSSEAFATLVHGIQSGQTEVLRNIGLNVSMEQSYKQIAAQLHKNVDQLTQNEKVQGVLNSVMRAGADIAGTYEAAMGTAGKQLNSLKRFTEDLKVVQGEVFNEVLTLAVAAYTDHIKESLAATKELSRDETLKEWGRGIADVFVFVADNVNNLIGAVKFLLATIQYAYDNTKNYLQLLKATSKGIDIVDQYESTARSIQHIYDKKTKDIFDSEDKFSKAISAKRKSESEKRALEEEANADHEAVKFARQNAIARKKFLEDQDKLTATPRAAKVDKTAEKEYDLQVEKLRNLLEEEKTNNQLRLDLLETYHRAGLTSDEKYFISRKTLLEKNEQAEVDSIDKQIAALEKLNDIQAKRADYTTAIEAEVNRKFEDLYGKRDQIIRKAANDKEILEVEAYVKTYQAAMAQNEAIGREVESIYNQVDAIKLKIATYGKSTSEVTKATIAELEYKLALTEVSDQEGDVTRSLKARISALKELAAAQETENSLEKEANRFKELWTSVDQTAKSAFTSILNGGKDAFTRLRDTLKSSLLDLLYQMTIKKWVFNITANISGASPTSLQSVAGSISGLSGIGGLGDLGAAGSLIGTGGLNGLANGLAMGAGALGPIVLGGMLLKNALSGGETRSGGGFNIDQLTGKAVYAGGPSGGMFGNGAVEATIESTYASLKNTLSALGSSAQIQQFTAGLESSANGKGGTFAGGVINGRVFGQRDQEKKYKFDLTPEEAITKLGLNLKQSAIEALQIVGDIPASVYEKVKNVPAKFLNDEQATKLLQTINNQIAGVTGFKAALESLPFVKLQSLTFDLTSSVVDFSGGLQNVQSNLSIFADKFYSENEKINKTSELLAAKLEELGYSSIKTKDQFKNLIEGFKVTDDASAKTFASLLSLSGAFATVADSAVAMTSAMESTALSDARQSLISDAESAFSALSNSIQAEKDRLQKEYESKRKEFSDSAAAATSALQASKSVFDMFSNALTSIRPLTRTAAESVLRKALNSSNLSEDPVGLQNAISVLSQDNSKQYASALAMQREQARVGNLMSDVKDKARAQVSTQTLILNSINANIDQLDLQHKESIKVLDDQLAAAKSQLDVLKGINATMLSVADALTAFNKASDSAKNPEAASAKVINDTYNKYLKRDADAPGLKFWMSSLASGNSLSNVVNSIASSNESKVQNLYETLLNRTGESAGVDFWTTALNNGVSLDSIRNSFLNSPEYLKKVRGYSTGGDHAGGLAWVGESGPELVNIGPSNIVNSTNSLKMLQDNADVAALLKQLVESFTQQSSMQESRDVAVITRLRELVGYAKRWDLEGLTVKNSSDLPLYVDQV